MNVLPLPRGAPRFEVRFFVHSDGTLRVEVSNPARTVPVVIHITRPGGPGA